jgi:hypothetical protein
MTPLVQQAVKVAPQPETAMWFDVGRLTPLPEAQRYPVDILMHPPFKRTGIAGIDSKGRKFSLWRKERNHRWMHDGAASIL